MSTQDSPSTNRGRSPVACLALGAVFIGVGLYYLFNPAAEVEGIANMHKLAVGQAFTVAGSIFLAMALRPRA